VEHEAELAVVIKRTVKGIAGPAALDAVLGYTGFIDVSLRTGDGDLSRKKSYDTFAPMGPCLVTPDEVPEPDQLGVRLWVNGALRQNGSTADLLLSISQLIERAASVMTLHPGDIIATGTPEGVGPVRPGDQVALEIEKIGRLEVPVETTPEWRR
jgi:2-keto-4-pentenoate hydratase/2-oxohepta-3-ene-1,7-dioic acid hydratase in catechol pathway